MRFVSCAVPLVSERLLAWARLLHIFLFLHHATTTRMVKKVLRASRTGLSQTGASASNTFNGAVTALGP